VDLTSKLKDMKSGPGNRSSRLAHLRTERAIAQKKLQNYEAGSVATGLFNVFTGGGTSLASSIEDKKNEIASCDEQINEIENQPAITQAQTDQAQHDYDNFMATVPW
jgi:chromosome segregation ATPase